MSTIVHPAQSFFEACESGKGWEGCKEFCHPHATFSSQTGALAGISTLKDYCEWMKNLFTPIPNGHYELRFFGVDEARNTVAAYAVFHGNHTGPGGPGAPAGNAVSADYVYAMKFEGVRIQSMTKIWNDTISLRQLGWA